MILVVCAWHPRYTARRKLLRVRQGWRVWTLEESHGICAACRTRLVIDEIKAEITRLNLPLAAMLEILRARRVAGERGYHFHDEDPYDPQQTY